MLNARLCRRAQVFAQSSLTSVFALPDMQVDGPVTDRQHAVALQSCGDLLALQAREQRLDQAGIAVGKSSATRATIGFAGLLCTATAAVAADPVRDAAWRPTARAIRKGALLYDVRPASIYTSAKVVWRYVMATLPLLLEKLHCQCPRSRRNGSGQRIAHAIAELAT